MHDIDFVMNRIMDLKTQNSENRQDRWRIRAIMNGGADGMYAVMAWDKGKGASVAAGQRIAAKMGVDLPTVNLIASGSDRLGQKLGRPPTLKPPRADDEKVRERQNKKVQIVRGWDIEQRMELDYPQIGRWLPGYAFFTWVIRQRRDRNGDFYPVAELRDPYDIDPGYFGAEQQPQDMAVNRRVPLYALEHSYPDLNWNVIGGKIRAKRAGAGIIMDPRFAPDMNGIRSWEGKRTGIEVVEYYSHDGTYICIPEVEMGLDYIESPIGEPMFAFGKKISFDKLISQYYHSIGLMGMMGKLNALGLIAAEEGVFRETNIYGDMVGGTYERGRFASNYLERDARVEKPTSDQQQQIFQQIDRVERQLRIGANYDVQQDAISPNSFATGKGMQELQGSLNANVRELQLAIKHANELADSKRLAFAREVYGGKRRKFFDMYGKEKWYNPAKDISSDVRTRRIYGAMATFDENEVIVAGLQLLQGEIIDTLEMQENIDNLHDIDLINERITAKKFEDVLLGILTEQALTDPSVAAALVEIMENPKDKTKILTKWFTPQEPEMSTQEQDFAQQGMMGGMGGGPGTPGAPGAPPAVGTLLAQMEGGGQSMMGAQTVTPFGPG
ncbi:hypothetical protein DRQ50_14350, partial [bacterium]